MGRENEMGEVRGGGRWESGMGEERVGWVKGDWDRQIAMGDESV